MAKNSKPFSEAKKQYFERSADYRRYARGILDLLPVKSGKLLDVGCGLGWIVKEAQNRGFEALGIDPASPYVQLGKKELGVDLKASNLEKFKTREKFDVVILNHVLEHIKNLDSFLEKIHILLRPNGILLVACPNIASLMYFIFKDRWYGLVPSQHHWQFSPKTLTQALRRNRFKTGKIIINSLDYQPKVFKKLLFAVLITFANMFRIGDQVVIICHRR